MKRRCGVLLLVGLWGVARCASAQLIVEDPLNLVQNTVTATQAVLTVANQVLELTGFDVLSLDDGDYAADLAALRDVVNDASALSFDIGSLEAQVAVLFDLGSAPNGSDALRQRLADMRRAVVEAYVYALRTQTLLRTTLTTIGHLEKLFADLETLLGNQQSNQALIQHQATLNKTLAALQTQSAAFAHAQTVERLSEPLTIESLGNIFDAIMEDHP